ncbi:hypothetical protein [uncultured Sphingomonas sp.]|uniref:hypothetical protein n=1 Tax=uncultured Sphingomonas sp. TaxID=158754 RepID=UPI0030DACBF6
MPEKPSPAVGQITDAMIVAGRDVIFRELTYPDIDDIGFYKPATVSKAVFCSMLAVQRVDNVQNTPFEGPERFGNLIDVGSAPGIWAYPSACIRALMVA